MMPVGCSDLLPGCTPSFVITYAPRLYPHTVRGLLPRQQTNNECNDSAEMVGSVGSEIISSKTLEEAETALVGGEDFNRVRDIDDIARLA